MKLLCGCCNCCCRPVRRRAVRPIVPRWATAAMQVVLCCFAVLAVVDWAGAQRAEPAPTELAGVGVTEHLNVQIPLELPFVDSSGRPVTLAEMFDGEHPVILTLNYSNCPMLCSLQLNGLFDGLKAMRWNLGKEFRMLTVSIDPKELPERAQLTKQKYLKLYRRGGSESGWHVLTGKEEHIRRLADVVGFGYVYLPEQNQYAHAAVSIVCTPTGRVARYLYGIRYDPQTLRLALVEASEGKVGSSVDRFLLFCFHYDADKGRYAPAAFRLMQIGAALTTILVGGLLLVFWRRDRRGGAASDEPASAPGATGNSPADSKLSGNGDTPATTQQDH